MHSCTHGEIREIREIREIHVLKCIRFHEQNRSKGSIQSINLALNSLLIRMKGTSEHMFYREYEGLWTLELTIDMQDEHCGHMNCVVRKFGGCEVRYYSHLMIDNIYKMVYFYNPVYMKLHSCFSQGDDVLQIGIRHIKRRKLFPHFIGSFRHLREIVVRRFYGDGWVSRKDFTYIDCSNIRERAFSQAIQGGLESWLPRCVLRSITDSLNGWANTEQDVPRI